MKITFFLKLCIAINEDTKKKKTMMSHAYICLRHILLEYVRIMTTIALKQKHVKIFHMDFAKNKMQLEETPNKHII